MTTADFLQKLQDLLQRDEPIALDSYLWDMEEWDSLAIMACMAFFDKTFGVKTSFGQYKALGTPADLAALANGAVRP